MTRNRNESQVAKYVVIRQGQIVYASRRMRYVLAFLHGLRADEAVVYRATTITRHSPVWSPETNKE